MLSLSAIENKKPGTASKFFLSPCLNGGRLLKLRKEEHKEITCASWLKKLCESVLTQLSAERGEGADESGGVKGAVVEYTNLPDVVTNFIYPDHFGMGQELLEAHMPYLSKAAR